MRIIPGPFMYALVTNTIRCAGAYIPISFYGGYS